MPDPSKRIIMSVDISLYQQTKFKSCARLNSPVQTSILLAEGDFKNTMKIGKGRAARQQFGSIEEAQYVVDGDLCE